MCLLMVQTINSPRLSDDWLRDFYQHNSDGAGVMYVEDGAVCVHKLVPRDAQELIEFYREHAEGRNCAVHLRMATHGDVNLTNCHPYEVLNVAEHGVDLWLMHNGILSTGNKADTTKSDTWHYIHDYLRPILASDPSLVANEAFQTIVEDHIGSNRFATIDVQHGIQLFNGYQGLRWGGRWMSNTYAWSAPFGCEFETAGARSEEEEARIAQEEVDAGPFGGYDLYGTSYGDYRYGGYRAGGAAKGGHVTVVQGSQAAAQESVMDDPYDDWGAPRDAAGAAGAAQSDEVLSYARGCAKELLIMARDLRLDHFLKRVSEAQVVKFILDYGEDAADDVLDAVASESITESEFVRYFEDETFADAQLVA